MQQAWVPPAAPDANTFRIFISTDNHLGYHERADFPPRQEDSFRAVEEVLENANAAKVC
jgi:DNA repair exonuclease SbcCD nuclease subunit